MQNYTATFIRPILCVHLYSSLGRLSIEYSVYRETTTLNIYV